MKGRKREHVFGCLSFLLIAGLIVLRGTLSTRAVLGLAAPLAPFALAARSERRSRWAGFRTLQLPKHGFG